MPYIKQADRERLNSLILALAAEVQSDGELNYAITRLAHYRASDTGGNYAAFNAIIGVMEAAKLEFYRRRVAPYEDKKIEENGDI